MATAQSPVAISVPVLTRLFASGSSVALSMSRNHAIHELKIERLTTVGLTIYARLLALAFRALPSVAFACSSAIRAVIVAMSTNVEPKR